MGFTVFFVFKMGFYICFMVLDGWIRFDGWWIGCGGVGDSFFGESFLFVFWWVGDSYIFSKIMFIEKRRCTGERKDGWVVHLASCEVGGLYCFGLLVVGEFLDLFWLYDEAFMFRSSFCLCFYAVGASTSMRLVGAVPPKETRETSLWPFGSWVVSFR